MKPCHFADCSTSQAQINGIKGTFLKMQSDARDIRYKKATFLKCKVMLHANSSNLQTPIISISRKHST